MQVGYGVEETSAAEILKLIVSEPPKVKYVGLGTTGQAPAEFRILSTQGKDWMHFLLLF